MNSLTEKERWNFWEKIKACPADKELSSWTAIVQVLDFLTATGQVLDSWTGIEQVILPESACLWNSISFLSIPFQTYPGSKTCPDLSRPVRIWPVAVQESRTCPVAVQEDKTFLRKQPFICCSRKSLLFCNSKNCFSLFLANISLLWAWKDKHNT